MPMLANKHRRALPSWPALVLAPFLLLANACVQAQAQGSVQDQNGPGAPGLPGGRRAQRLGQLENAKIAFITSRVALTQEQAQRFWPLYNEFSARRRDLHRNGRLLRRALTEADTDAQIRDQVQQSFAARQQELNLEKDYFEKFQKVITLRQVAQLFNAERDFTREVIKRVTTADSN